MRTSVPNVDAGNELVLVLVLILVLAGSAWLHATPQALVKCCPRCVGDTGLDFAAACGLPLLRLLLATLPSRRRCLQLCVTQELHARLTLGLL